MMKVIDFTGWEKQENLTGGTKRLDHKIGFRLHTDNNGADITISADLLKEVGSRRFDLLKRRDVYALVPNNNGSLYVREGQSRLSGIGIYAILDVAKTCGIDIKREMQHINGFVYNCAIMFPAEHFFDGWKEDTK